MVESTPQPSEYQADAHPTELAGMVTYIRIIANDIAFQEAN